MKECQVRGDCGLLSVPHAHSIWPDSLITRKLASLPGLLPCFQPVSRPLSARRPPPSDSMLPSLSEARAWSRQGVLPGGRAQEEAACGLQVTLCPLWALAKGVLYLQRFRYRQTLLLYLKKCFKSHKSNFRVRTSG